MSTVAAPPPRRVPLWGPLAGRLVYRNVVVGRRSWLLFVSGFFEPVFFLLGIGLGVGALVGDVSYGGELVPYKEFVAPAMLAASAMNGAVFESTINVFAKLKWLKTYDGVLATPLGIRDVALGELIYALIRGGVYAVGFVVVMLAMGLVASWWALLAVPAAVLVGAAFAAVGLIGVTFMRSWADFSMIELVTLPLFLFSATFVPLSDYPAAAQWIVPLTPLYHGVELLRALTLGSVGWVTLVHVAYLAVMIVVGLAIADGRLRSSCSSSRDAGDGLDAVADHEGQAVAETCELELVVEIERLPVVELRSQPARHRQRVFHSLPVHRVVDVPVEVDVRHPQRPPCARGVGCRIRQLEPRRDVAACRSVSVHAEVLDPGGPLLRVEMDPDAVDLDVAPGVALHRPAPPGRDRRHAAAPGRQLDLGVAGERLDHVDQDGAHEPKVIWQPPARLLDVVDRDVLEEASHRIEPQPPGGVHVGQADSPRRGHRATSGRHGSAGVQHGSHAKASSSDDRQLGPLHELLFARQRAAGPLLAGKAVAEGPLLAKRRGGLGSHQSGRQDPCGQPLLLVDTDEQCRRRGRRFAAFTALWMRSRMACPGCLHLSSHRSTSTPAQWKRT